MSNDMKTIFVLVQIARGKYQWQTWLHVDYVSALARKDKRVRASELGLRDGIRWIGKRIPASQWVIS